MNYNLLDRFESNGNTSYVEDAVEELIRRSGKQSKSVRIGIDRILFEYDYMFIDEREAAEQIAEVLGISIHDAEAWL